MRIPDPRKIPLVGKLIVRVIRNIRKRRFTTSEDYWIKRYKKGGNSGAGSHSLLALFKAKIINEFVAENGIESVIEFGCGDGDQINLFNFKSYKGFDVSHEAIAICNSVFTNDPTRQFDLIKNHSNEKADLTLSLDVIYHLTEWDTYDGYLRRLFDSSTRFVIIYSSNSDDHENNDVAPHVKHRKFTGWVTENAPDFKLIKHVPNRYPYNGDGRISSYADFYIFQKTSTNG